MQNDLEYLGLYHRSVSFVGSKWVWFSVLCLLAGSQWAAAWLVPGAMPAGVAQMAIHHGAAAMLLGGVALWRRESFHGFVRIALFAVLAFGVPGLLFNAPQGHVSSYDSTVVLMLVPVVVIIVMAQRTAEFGVEQSPLRPIVPVLVAVGGATLLLPLSVPVSGVGKSLLAAMIASAIVAGYAATRLHELVRGASVFAAGTVIAGVCAVLEGIYARVTWGDVCQIGCSMTWKVVLAESLRGLCIEVPLLLLTVWLLRELRPELFSGRLLAIPLVTMLGSLVVMRPGIDWTQGAGLVMMAVGIFWLWRHVANDEPNGRL